MKIKFTSDYKVKDEEGRVFKAGSVHDMGEASAMHFVRRGVAVDLSKEVDERKETEKEIEEQPSTPKKQLNKK